MTPAEEATFIALWQQRLETAAIARQLGIPPGTVSSRAKRLVVQGKLQPRPRGGAYPSQRAHARQAGAPALHPRPPASDPPAPPPATAPAPTREAPAITFMAVPEVRDLIHTVKDLVARVAALEDGTRAPLARVHQTVDGAVLASPDRGGQSPGGCGGQGAQPSGGGGVMAGAK